MKRLLFAISLLCFSLVAHVGVNDVFFEGLAGPYPLYVTIRPPIVIPGIAEISIRSAARDVKSIQFTPMTLTGAGSKYPPTPDRAVQSKEDPQLFTGGLWIMFPGAWQVRAMVEGERGAGSVSIPVPAASQKLSTMDGLTGSILALLMLVLAAGVTGIAGAAIRESQLGPEQQPDRNRIRRGRIAMAGGVVLSIMIIWFGRDWWNAESKDYSKSIYKPLVMQASLSGSHLDLQLSSSGWLQPKGTDDFVADHGHLMHLYAIREPGLDAIFHLHPERREAGKFSHELPQMPKGKYRLFADVVHGSGFPETLTASLELPQDTTGPSSSIDDAGSVLPMNGKHDRTVALGGGGQVVFDPPGTLRANQPATLRFRVFDADGNPAPNLRLYLGMAAHLALVKNDFSVFSHIHPYGNISMAAFEMAQSSLLPLGGNVLVSSHVNETGSAAVPAEFSFPFGFPTAGEYRLVLQFAGTKRVETVSFDIAVVI